MLNWLIGFMITSMIFFPSPGFDETPEDYGFSYENVSVVTEDGARLFGWYLKARTEEKGAVLFFHGNAGNISHRLFKVKGWLEQGLSVFLIDYRGYGKSEGSIRNQDDVLRDARASLDWLRQTKGMPDSKIILYGESLGTYPAVRFAAESRFGALMLESVFTSFTDLGKKHYAYLPDAIRNLLLKDFEFSNTATISRVKTPVFILHGEQDNISPVEMARKIFDLAPEPKKIWIIPHAGHNDIPLVAGEEYGRKTGEFFTEYLGSSAKS